MRLVNGLLRNTTLEVWHEKDYKYNAPHHFTIIENLGDGRGGIIETIDFQEGPVGEVGVNGISNEILLSIVLARLQAFQNSEFSTRDNAIAITHIEDALLRLNKRTDDRLARNVEGTSAI
ncbi:hypothetical protein D3C77_628990 [compost metagenome]